MLGGVRKGVGWLAINNVSGQTLPDVFFYQDLPVVHVGPTSDQEIDNMVKKVCFWLERIRWITYIRVLFSRFIHH